MAILIFIDAPDPDNFMLVKAIFALFLGEDVKVVLTGRPVRFNANKSHQLWQWDLESSRMAQEASAARLKNFMRNLGVKVVEVYDGGIAPRTLVPHSVHFQEYYKFLDVDPLAAIRYTELSPQEELVEWILSRNDPVKVVVGGPMTGLRQVIERNPAVADKITEIHAMFATWGTKTLMDFGGEPRGAQQFNVACDPVSAHFILKGLKCPIYLMPSEVTRHAPIGFANVQALRDALPNNAGVNKLLALYAIWYDAAIRPRQDKNPEEMIYIHDIVSAFSLDAKLRNGIYDVVPIAVEEVPYLPDDRANWGTVRMRILKPDEPTNVYAAKGFVLNGELLYLKTLRDIFR